MRSEDWYICDDRRPHARHDWSNGKSYCPGRPLARCIHCDGFIEHYEESASHGDVLNSWWAHLEHPNDNHDAQP